MTEVLIAVGLGAVVYLVTLGVRYSHTGSAGRSTPLTPDADNVAPPDREVHSALRALGLNEPFRHAGGPFGARGMVDGFRVAAAYELLGFELAIALRGVLERGITIGPERMRRTPGDVLLGDPAFDDRFVVTGSREALVLHFGHDARSSLIAAAAADWRLSRDELRCARVAADAVGGQLGLGIRAARALVVTEPAGRLADIARRDPVPRMRRRALHLLLLQHPTHEAATSAARDLASAADPVLALIARRPAMPAVAWVSAAAELVARSDEGAIELAEALQDLQAVAALPALGARLSQTRDEETRRALTEAKLRLQATGGATSGHLALAPSGSRGGLTEAPEPPPER